MEKILLAMDANNLEMNAVDFGCYIARLTRSRLTGVFLEGLISEREEVALTGANPSDVNIRRFREACVCRDTLSVIHRDRGIPIAELIAESRFADLIIVDADTSFAQTGQRRFVTDALEASECPILLAPYHFDGPEEIILTYNGTASSVYAIKQFAHLFPELRHTPTTVVNVRPEGGSAIEEQFKMKEWVKAHFDQVEFMVLKGHAADELFDYLTGKKNAFVVMGAFGRNLISQLLKPSHARHLIRTINLPLFITHR